MRYYFKKTLLIRFSIIVNSYETLRAYLRLKKKNIFLIFRIVHRLRILSNSNNNNTILITSRIRYDKTLDIFFDFFQSFNYNEI